jgi:hypothetical protein
MPESVSDKVKSPFTREQRNQLLAWSKEAKDQKLLSAFDRKVLYEGGYYNYIFTSRLSRLNKTLDVLVEALEEEPTFFALEIIDTSYQCYLKTGAAKGDPESKFRLGEAYYFGFFGCEEDETLALDWIQSASNDGCAGAQCMLGRIIQRGDCGLEANEIEGRELIIQAAHQEFPEAELYLGHDFYERCQIEENPSLGEEAVFYFEKALKGGVDRAKRYLANCHEFGIGVVKNEKKAFKLMQSAAQSDSRSITELGVYYAEGIGTKVNVKKAIETWKIASEEDEPEAFYKLGRCYYDGIYLEKDDEEAYHYFKLAAESNYPAGQFYLGLLQYRGEGFYGEDEEYAPFENFELALENGEEEAGFFLGMCYYNGIGIGQNYPKSVEYFEAYKEANANSLFYLGECARNGTGRRQSYDDAIEFYLKAAEEEIAIAQMAVGRAFCFGEAVEADYEDAVKWFELAVKKGNRDGQYWLGQCYFDGLGVERNIPMALDLFRDSASKGHKLALEFLHENGYDMEEAEAVSVDTDDETIVSVYQDATSRAKSLYNKTSKKWQELENIKNPSNIIEFKSQAIDIVDEMMSNDDDD